jgi:GAF domain-containing protein
VEINIMPLLIIIFKPKISIVICPWLFIPPTIHRPAGAFTGCRRPLILADLDEVLNKVMDEVITATRAERGFVMLYDAGEQLAFQVARGLDQRTIEDPRFQVSRSIIEKVAREGKPILTSDAQSDNRFSMRESVVILGLRSILCVPLKSKEAVLGIVYVDNRLQACIFTQADLELLTAIAASASAAIENARLYQVAVEKGRMERELQMARRVQTSLLPSTPDITDGRLLRGSCPGSGRDYLILSSLRMGDWAATPT